MNMEAKNKNGFAFWVWAHDRAIHMDSVVGT